MVADSGDNGQKKATNWTGGPWQPGQSGNPAQAEKWKNGGAPPPPKGGRPLSFESALKRKLKEVVDPASKRRVIDEVASNLVDVALNSQSDFARVAAIEKIADRIDGRPKQIVESKVDAHVTIETPAHISAAAARMFGRSEAAPSADD